MTYSKVEKHKIIGSCMIYDDGVREKLTTATLSCSLELKNNKLIEKSFLNADIDRRSLFVTEKNLISLLIGSIV